jgi:uncharacterized protein YutE (UPF0331/DUF86 family)
MQSIDSFDNIVQSLATARLLLQKAHTNESAIEGLCLYVSIIDGFLRLALIYARTQKSPSHTYEFSVNLISQNDGDKTYSEKEIYDFAFKEKIISDNLYKKLDEMYLFRNKVIHRFAISGITYKQIADACSKFELIYQEIFNIVAILEYGESGLKNPTSQELEHFKKFTINKVLG